MSTYTGTDGDVSGLVSGRVVSWSIDTELDTSKYMDSETVDGDSDPPTKRTSIGGRDWNGSITINADDADAAPEEGDKGSVTLIEQSGREWSGNAVIVGVSGGVEVESEEVVQYEISIEGDGELSRPT